jgi:galactokinase
LRAACEAISAKWGAGTGIDAAMISNLPAAAGLSSSSALIVAFTLALLKANRRSASFAELMEVLPDGEQFVGTRGGGMDHAASLASVAGCASLIEFNPLSLRPVKIPDGWRFLAAHSLTTAEKSGSAREQYNLRRAAGSTALKRLGFDSYRAVLHGRSGAEIEELAWHGLNSAEERDSFLHVTSEALRVRSAVAAMEGADAEGFGRTLLESHASLRDRLKVSCAALDRLVETAMECGARGARLTGAGFGGCVVCFALASDATRLRRGLIEKFYASKPEFDEGMHLIDVEPADGALRGLS